MYARRLKLNKTKLFLRLLMIVILGVSLTMAVKSSANGQSFNSHREVFVVQGDTLWDLSKKHKLGDDIQKTVLDIMELNNMKTCDVYPGQKIKIPINL